MSDDVTYPLLDHNTSLKTNIIELLALAVQSTNVDLAAVSKGIEPLNFTFGVEFNLPSGGTEIALWTLQYRGSGSPAPDAPFTGVVH